MALITLEQAINHLRLDVDQTQAGSPPEYTDPRVSDLLNKMELASAVILDYLKIDGASSGWTAQQTFNVEAAALFALAALYDDEMDRTLADYMKPLGVITLLLMRMRDPALA